MSWEVYALLGALFVVLVIAALMGWRREGRKSAEAAQHKRTADHARKAHEIDDDVARTSESDLDDELRGE